MMYDLWKDLYGIVEKRKIEHEEGSYTAYLFDMGLDKVLKKLGEETTETIIAAKNLKACVDSGADGETAQKAREDLDGEVGDMLYHLVVMLDMLGIEPDEIEDLLSERMKKTRNLKDTRQTSIDS